MKKCGEDCIPCCDYCKYVVHEVIEFEGGKGIGSPIFCKLHLDEEHRQLARRCSYCEDFWCMNAEKEESKMESICNDCLLKDYCYWNGKVNFIGCEMKRTSNTDTCVACGAPVPEGSQVCGKCGGQNE